jgi:hypothetical protein
MPRKFYDILLIRKKLNVLNFFRTNFDKKEEEKKGKKHFS